jgi:hypothetical protein
VKREQLAPPPELAARCVDISRQRVIDWRARLLARDVDPDDCRRLLDALLIISANLLYAEKVVSVLSDEWAARNESRIDYWQRLYGIVLGRLEDNPVGPAPRLPRITSLWVSRALHSRPLTAVD